MRVVPVLCLLAGCFTKPPNLTDDPIDAQVDASIPAACGDIPFSGLRALPGLDSVSIVEPTITGDLLEVYFTTQPGSKYAIGYAKRSLPSSPFTVMGTVPFEPSNNIPPDASVTADGNLLVYRAEQGGIRGLYSVTRQGSVWGAPSLVPGIGTKDVSSFEISGNGLTLYLVATELEVARRSTRTDTFVIDGSIGPELRYPTVTADGLELFYNDEVATVSVIKRATRTSEMASFLGGPQVFTGLDPDLTGDGQFLVFANSSGRGLMIAERACSP